MVLGNKTPIPAPSVWFNVKNWQYRLSDEKVLLSRTSNNQEFNPRITLAPYENNIQSHKNSHETHHPIAPAPPPSTTLTHLGNNRRTGWKG